MQNHGVTLILIFDLAVVTLALSGAYLGNCKVQKVNNRHSY